MSICYKRIAYLLRENLTGLPLSKTLSIIELLTGGPAGQIIMTANLMFFATTLFEHDSDQCYSKIDIILWGKSRNIKTDVLTTQKIAYYSMSPVARLIEEFQE
jgi:hypothetical protein